MRFLRLVLWGTFLFWVTLRRLLRLRFAVRQPDALFRTSVWRLPALLLPPRLPADGLRRLFIRLRISGTVLLTLPELRLRARLRTAMRTVVRLSLRPVVRAGVRTVVRLWDAELWNAELRHAGLRLLRDRVRPRRRNARANVRGGSLGTTPVFE